jgi:hypothetical protein
MKFTKCSNYIKIYHFIKSKLTHFIQQVHYSKVPSWIYWIIWMKKGKKIGRIILMLHWHETHIIYECFKREGNILEKLVHVFYTSCGFQDSLGNPNNQGIHVGFRNLSKEQSKKIRKKLNDYHKYSSLAEFQIKNLTKAFNLFRKI